MGLVHGTACIAPLFVVCKRSFKIDERRSFIRRLDMVHEMACRSPQPLVWKSRNEMDTRRVCITQ